MQGRRNEEAGAGWGGVDRDPFWPISNPIPTMGADYAHQITNTPPTQFLNLPMGLQ